jgi:SAM-dependent methyltransferase
MVVRDDPRHHGFSQALQEPDDMTGDSTDRADAAPSQPARRYLLDNASREAGARFAGLEAVLDPVSRRHLTATGLTRGWRCWEVGAGGGSMAAWLAELTGPAGEVLATDLNIDWIGSPALPNLVVREHDVVEDPIPQDAYDLIHARLVLLHLPEREAVIWRLAGALKPGGWLVLEEFEEILDPCLDPTTDRERLVNRMRAGLLELLRGNGADTAYPRRLPRLLREVGLACIRAEGHLAYVNGGSDGALIYRANVMQLSDQLIGAGLLSAQEVEDCLGILADPDFTYALPLLISARGRRV